MYSKEYRQNMDSERMADLKKKAASRMTKMRERKALEGSEKPRQTRTAQDVKSESFTEFIYSYSPGGNRGKLSQHDNLSHDGVSSHFSTGAGNCMFTCNYLS